MKTLDIVGLKPSQIDAAAEVLASAFSEDPLFLYLTPEEEQSQANALRWICRIALKYSQPYGYIYTTVGDMKGIAAWIPPKQSSLSIFRLLQVGLYAFPFKLGWSNIGRFLSLFSIIEKFHEHDMPQPHWYLSMLGVAPSVQGQGIGSSLLQPILNQADREGLPSYLETSTEQAVRFYQKHQFEVLRTHELTKGSRQLWTMKREPQKILKSNYVS